MTFFFTGASATGIMVIWNGISSINPLLQGFLKSASNKQTAIQFNFVSLEWPTRWKFLFLGFFFIIIILSSNTDRNFWLFNKLWKYLDFYFVAALNNSGFERNCLRVFSLFQFLGNFFIPMRTKVLREVCLRQTIQNERIEELLRLKQSTCSFHRSIIKHCWMSREILVTRFQLI